MRTFSVRLIGFSLACALSIACSSGLPADKGANDAGSGGTAATGGMSTAATGGASCPVGAETCACSASNMCNAGLTCASRICVYLGTGGSGAGGAVAEGGMTSTGGTTATGGNSAAAGNCVTPPSGIISWWPGDGNASDIVGKNNGTPQNGAGFAPGFVTSGSGQAFSVDGVSAYVSVPNDTSIDFSIGSSFTIELWAYRTNSAQPIHVMGKRIGCGGGQYYQLAIGGGGFPSDQVPLNKWTHLALVCDMTRSAQTQLMYLNGSLVVNSPFSGSFSNTADLHIGTSATCAAFGGLLDEVTMYNRILSQSEIQSIVAAGAAGKCKGSQNSGGDAG